MTGTPGRLRRSIAGALPVLLAAGLLFGQHPGSVAADHGGQPIEPRPTCGRPETGVFRCTSVGNNLRHFVHFDGSLTEGLASSLRDTMAEDYGSTDLIMIEQAEITAVTDVIAFSVDYGDNGAAGWVNCPPDAPQGLNSVGHRWCQRQEIWFNLHPRFAVYFEDDGSRDHVTCHELGHTLGLRHWGQPPTNPGPAEPTCMHVNTPDGPTELNQIDKDHINAYPYEAPLRPRARYIARAPEAPAAGMAWRSSIVAASEVESFASLGQLTRSADATVRGRIVAVEPGRVFGAESGHPLHYAAAALSVEEVLAGELPAKHAARLTLEIPLFDGPDALSALRSSLVGAESIFFLRSKRASARAGGLSVQAQLEEAQFYRLVIFRGVVVNHGGRAAVMPSDVDDPDFLTALGGLPFDDVVGRVREAGR